LYWPARGRVLPGWEFQLRWKKKPKPSLPQSLPLATGTSTLALQLPFPKISESMGNHDSKIVDAGSVD
jgi:hypothetical protein